MNKTGNTLLLSMMLGLPVNVLAAPVTNTEPDVLALMGKMESVRDPKCHATATRLEGLIYGTPLTDEARYLKSEMQKTLAKTIWQQAAKMSAADTLEQPQIQKAADGLFSIAQTDKRWQLTTPTMTVDIEGRDKDHYGSIAYGLRAMLAVEQESLLDLTGELPMLSEQASAEMVTRLDLATLALLKQADIRARLGDEYKITPKDLTQAWQALFPSLALAANADLPKQAAEPRQTGLMHKVVEQKIQSFAKYNQVSQALFARNLQVYFARMSLPKDETAAKEFKQYFTEAMIAFSANFYLLAQAQAGSDAMIRESHVEHAMQQILPHKVNQYEDVIFYPKYPSDMRREIEAYDMDAFRDGGFHWIYLREALKDLGDRIKLETDPYAAELLSEGIAHYGVLLLREAGELGKAQQKEALSSALVTEAYKQIEAEIAAYHAYKVPASPAKGIVSATDTGKPGHFRDVTQAKELNAEHRTSDWLSRQLRSYLRKDAETGVSTIPPAFGGGGIAAEDVNGDGLIDVLVLSGSGNKLFINKGDHFEDATEGSGLDNTSRHPVPKDQPVRAGEPRQPLIADWDNDGDQDIFISYVGEPHRIYANQGDGHFKEMTDIAKLGGADAVGGPATTFDVNNDGLLDIYIEYFGNYLKGELPTLKRRNDNGGRNVLFINKGNFKFELAADALGADNNGWGQAVTHADLNQDGWQDLIVGNDFGVNAYYINQQGKKFVDYAAKLGTDKPSYTMNIGLGDLNRDGIADVYISNIVTMNKDQKYVLPNEDMTAQFNPDKLGNMRVVEGNDLFMSGRSDKGVLSFALSDKVGRGYSSTGWAWDADFFDADNDGDEDLYVLNGMNDYFVYSSKNPYYQDPNNLTASTTAYFPDASRAANVFFSNSDGKLNNTSADSGLDFVANSRSAAYLDMDNDGDLDIVVNNFHDKARLFENQSESLHNNWLKLHLVGAPDKGVNLDAIGAQILVGFDEKGYGWRQVTGGQGYMSVHPKEQHFGLGKASEARVMVIWPNGKHQTLGKLAANKRYEVTYAPDSGN
ncbi:CRTAC1 family protein [Shewanella sedimentimangrovi]|uniref:CRTAC1 family protein n=1 Tax=Shewanella sedimentimangrovi TaxID=2814293 RepID=A0ABX7QWY4_9GAMM|nr:CRTAC1 family protein [Shewanella sedimentimangrovi]QSX36017.1 CRTAC1 family protein [Shewanella sedimentimangrovi]